jgi:hypothetical protein
MLENIFLISELPRQFEGHPLVGSCVQGQCSPMRLRNFLTQAQAQPIAFGFWVVGAGVAEVSVEALKDAVV